MGFPGAVCTTLAELFLLTFSRSPGFRIRSILGCVVGRFQRPPSRLAASGVQRKMWDTISLERSAAKAACVSDLSGPFQKNM